MGFNMLHLNQSDFLDLKLDGLLRLTRHYNQNPFETNLKGFRFGFKSVDWLDKVMWVANSVKREWLLQFVVAA
ncbi:hypothetical protein ACOSQ3_005550 [Xanthoceras sorbifolium]